MQLVDFGVSQMCEAIDEASEIKDSHATHRDDSVEKTAGTPAFFAPEMCALVKSAYHGFPADR